MMWILLASILFATGFAAHIPLSIQINNDEGISYDNIFDRQRDDSEVDHEITVQTKLSNPFKYESVQSEINSKFSNEVINNITENSVKINFDRIHRKSEHLEYSNSVRTRKQEDDENYHEEQFDNFEEETVLPSTLFDSQSESNNNIDIQTESNLPFDDFVSDSYSRYQKDNDDRVIPLRISNFFDSYLNSIVTIDYIEIGLRYRIPNRWTDIEDNINDYDYRSILMSSDEEQNSNCESEQEDSKLVDYITPDEADNIPDESNYNSINE